MFKYRQNFKGLYTNSDIEILIATMNRESDDFLKVMFQGGIPPGIKLLVINQATKKKLTSGTPNLRIINSSEKGLSKSRNLALDNAVGTLCILADDDIVFSEGFEKKIIRAFNEYNNASFIRFCSERETGVPLKKYPANAKSELSWLDILNTSSVEMVVHRERVMEKNIRFDENFGLGSTFPMGEEQVFLARLKNAGLQLAYVPEYINKHKDLSTTEKVSIKEKYMAQGAITCAIFDKNAIYWVLLKIAFDIKHGVLNINQVKTALQYAKDGRDTYLNLQS